MSGHEYLRYKWCMKLHALTHFLCDILPSAVNHVNVIQFEGEGRRGALQRRDRKPQRMSAQERRERYCHITGLLPYLTWLLRGSCLFQQMNHIAYNGERAKGTGKIWFTTTTNPRNRWSPKFTYTVGGTYNHAKFYPNRFSGFVFAHAWFVSILTIWRSACCYSTVFGRLFIYSRRPILLTVNSCWYIVVMG